MLDKRFVVAYLTYLCFDPPNGPHFISFSALKADPLRGGRALYSILRIWMRHGCLTNLTGARILGMSCCTILARLLATCSCNLVVAVSDIEKQQIWGKMGRRDLQDFEMCNSEALIVISVQKCIQLATPDVRPRKKAPIFSVYQKQYQMHQNSVFLHQIFYRIGFKSYIT